MLIFPCCSLSGSIRFASPHSNLQHADLLQPVLNMPLRPFANMGLSKDCTLQYEDCCAATLGAEAAMILYLNISGTTHPQISDCHTGAALYSVRRICCVPPSTYKRFHAPMRQHANAPLWHFQDVWQHNQNYNGPHYGQANWQNIQDPSEDWRTQLPIYVNLYVPIP